MLWIENKMSGYNISISKVHIRFTTRALLRVKLLKYPKSKIIIYNDL